MTWPAAAGTANFFNGAGHDRRIGSAGCSHQKTWIAGGDGRLLAVEQLLVQLLARAQAGEADLDVLFGLQSRETDHLPREVDDLDRLAHIQDEDAAAFPSRKSGTIHPEDAGLQHQADGFPHRHEVALHVGVGDGQRTATTELALEQGNDGARWSRARYRSEP